MFSNLDHLRHRINKKCTETQTTRFSYSSHLQTREQQPLTQHESNQELRVGLEYRWLLYTSSFVRRKAQDDYLVAGSYGRLDDVLAMDHGVVAPPVVERDTRKDPI